MRDTKHRLNKYNNHKRTLFYVSIILFNIFAFTSIALFFNAQVNHSDDKLFSENLNNIATLNTASGNTMLTYSNSMDVKVQDSINYIKSNNLNYSETVDFLSKSNTDPDRNFQIIECGRYDSNGEVIFGNYSGILIYHHEANSSAKQSANIEIAYANGYEDLFDYFNDADDNDFDGVCFIPEYVDPGTKTKCFAVYRHINLRDNTGQQKLYTILLTSSSGNALTASNLQHEYKGQSAVLINNEGDYIIKSADYRNTNFFDYISNYNRISDKELQEVKDKVSECNNQNDNNTNLFYVNCVGEECVYSISGLDNDWHSVTCVPLTSFTSTDSSLNYSIIILIIFIALFLIDGIAIYFIWKVLRYNIEIAEKATAEAESANKAKSRFLSTMSHELRTPLNAIIGFSSIAKDHISNQVALTDYLKKIEISSQLLLHLISDILDISAIESSKMKLNKSEFLMSDLISSLSDIYKEQCKSKDIDFNVNLINMHDDMLIGDAVRVNQILLNFLSNAVKFTPDKGKILLNAEEVSRTDTSIVIKFEITDTGCGISEEMQKRLFQPFERITGNDAYKYSGTGLGLSIAKNLTELMNGQISAESTEGSGSTFRVEIPFELADSSAGDNKPVASSGNSKKIDLNGKRVLLVEDNAMNIEITKLLLQNVGLSVEVAVNGQLGYEAFTESDVGFFDAILMDIQMPIMNGYESAQAIRYCNHPHAKSIPIICMTADAFSEDVEKAFAAGMNAHLTKPIVAEDLYTLLNKHISK